MSQEIYEEKKEYEDDIPSISPQNATTKLEQGNAAQDNKQIGSWFTMATAGFAMLSDGLQNNIMTMTNVVFQHLYKSEYTPSVSTRVSNSLLVGIIIGQIFVGLICDRIGRKSAVFGTTFFIIIGIILATAAHGSTPARLFWFLTFARGITGIGVGGEYPACSTSTSEIVNEKMPSQRGPVFILVIFTSIAFGGPLIICIFLIVLSAAGENHLPTVWRTTIGVTVIFPIIALIFRWKMLHSELYKKGAMKRNVPYWLVLKRYWRSLIGTGGGWFLYDFVTIPNGIFSGTIIASVVKNSSVKSTAEWQLLLATIGSLPGVFIAVFLCNRIGRRATMMLGFSGYLIFGLIIGCAYDKITKIVPLFIIFYGLMQSMGGMGPGTMTGVTSTESYATAVRGTCYGLSAALGKTGAAIGTQSFTPIQEHLGKKYTFIIAACIGVLGIIVTYFFVPDMTGKNLAEEDAAFERYLIEQGWTGQLGESDKKDIQIVLKETEAITEKY